MKKFIIDRFEGMYAICEGENKAMISIPKYKLPPGSEEGDCLVLNSDGMYEKDKEATAERHKHMLDKMNRLFE